MAPRREESKILFPWERRRGLRSVFRSHRGRQLLFVVACLAAFGWLRHRDATSRAIRQTRQVIAVATAGIDAWRADHEGTCPSSFTDLVSRGYLYELPVDAWGQPLRMTCPGRATRDRFEVVSDGPDGEPGGLDRVE
jgi:general secretion pathway protein G